MATIYPAALSKNISRCHYLLCKIYCLIFGYIKAIIHIKLLSLCHDTVNIQENR
jgi:hypothetical protein